MRVNSEIDLEVDGRTLRYRVAAISVVAPTERAVLGPTAVPSVTLITCYPFYFVGSAPERYVVRAELAGT